MHFFFFFFLLPQLFQLFAQSSHTQGENLPICFHQREQMVELDEEYKMFLGGINSYTAWIIAAVHPCPTSTFKDNYYGDHYPSLKLILVQQFLSHAKGLSFPA